MLACQDLNRTGLKGTLIFLEMNLGQNNCLCMEKRVAKIIVPNVLIFKKSLFEVCLRVLLKNVVFFHLYTKTKCVNVSQIREDVIQKLEEFVSVLWRDTESLKNIPL